LRRLFESPSNLINDFRDTGLNTRRQLTIDAGASTHTIMLPEFHLRTIETVGEFDAVHS
jgi:hypothetical protein